MWERLEPMADWLAISTALQIQFGPSYFENPREELLKLKQSTTVNAYFESFNDLAARAYGLDDALLLDCFVGGLHPELKREVKARSPISLLQAVSLVKLFEEKFLPHTQRWVEPFHLSYNAMAGIPARRSIRFLGLVHGRDIRVLMDGGSSDNFIHQALV
ncbi:hypothetical protein Ahy_A09g045108 isoform B [Arachis hypogaea]|uniref:Retrotransposon gag domain-containing protein n=1 Tax=Arachis hypogaea TaxID=3818 RepID=A0A445BLK5_ARAHY|nr:hypothetical protein Ahy_A09g045108 isoform B [Arachis hypogaea]